MFLFVNISSCSSIELDTNADTNVLLNKWKSNDFRISYTVRF